MVVFVSLVGSGPLYSSLCYWGPAVPLYTLVSSTKKKNIQMFYLGSIQKKESCFRALLYRSEYVHELRQVSCVLRGQTQPAGN